MKKFLLSLLAVVSVALMSGCKGKTSNAASDQGKFTPEEAKSYLESGAFTLIVGFDAEFPPYGFRDETTNELVGFDLDLAREVAKRRGWELELRPINWDSKDAELNSNTINCIWNGFTINGREDIYEWSEPYLDNNQVIMVRSDSGINTLEDLAGKNVMAQADSSGLKAVNSGAAKSLRATFKSLTEVPDFNTAHMELQAGTCDAVVIDDGVAYYMVSRDKSCKVLDMPLGSEQYGVGFKKGNTVLRDWVQETLREMCKDGTFTEISKKWFNGKDKCIIKAE